MASVSAVRTVVALALADLWFERALSLCTILALAAVLAPLVVLAGLQEGVISGLRAALLEDAHVREIISVGNRSMSADLLDRILARTDVAFLAPRTRALAATLLLERPDAPGRGIRVELIPSAAGDPLLDRAPVTGDEIVLSAAAAAHLGVAAGAAVRGYVWRVNQGARETTKLPLVVAAVAPARAFGRDGAFVTLPLAVAIEDFQDDVADMPADLGGLKDPPDRAIYAGFRLYARRLEDVPELDAALRAADLNVISRAGDVAGLLRIDRTLRLLFALVASLGGAGFLVSLGAGLWANVERKRVSLALLAFMGARGAALKLFPMAQAGVLAAAGIFCAVSVALLAAIAINSLFAGVLAIDRKLCVINAGILAGAAVITLAGALAVAAVAGVRAARIEPWEGVSAA